MKKPIRIIPADELKNISPILYWQIVDDLRNHREVDAIRRVVEEAGCPLSAACRAVQSVRIDWRRRFPDPIEAETQILAAFDRLDLAAQRISAYAGHDLAMSMDYAARVQAGLPLRITPAQAEDVLRIAQDRIMIAAHELRKVSPYLSVDRAYEFVSALQKYYPAVLSASLPQPRGRGIPKPGERYDDWILTVELEPEVEARVCAGFPEESREGVRYLLSLYNPPEPAVNITRTLLSLLDEADGNEQALLRGMQNRSFNTVLDR